MLKKSSAVFFTGAVVSSLVLSACGNDTSSEDLEGESITVALSEGDIGQFNAWQARSEEFTEETGIEVEFTEIPYNNLLDRITTEGISGQGTFDLVTHLDVMGPSSRQFFEPLDEYAEADDYNFDRFPESTLDLSTYEGEIYSLPVRANAQLMFYRKDVFEDLGIDPPETWEELEQAGATITEETDMAGIAPYYQAGNNGQNLYMWTSYLWSNGADILDEDMRPVFNSEEGIEATQRYIDLLVEDEIATSGSVSFGEQEARTNFKQSNSAMWIGWWWVYSDFNFSDSSDEEVLGNVGFTTVPGWEGKESVSNISTFPLAMMQDSQNKEAAWEFMKWLSDPEFEKDVVLDALNGDSPSNQFSTDISQTANLNDEELNEAGDDLFTTGGESFENAQTLPKFENWPEVSDIISNAISNMATGESVEDNLNQAADDVERLLEEEGYYDE